MSNQIKIIETESNLTEEEILKIVDENQIVNVKIKSLVFPSIEEVMEYFEDVVDENKSSFVKYTKLAKEFEETDVYKDLQEKLEIAKENLYAFPETMIDKLRNQKSGTKGCSVCKSTINKDYLITNIEEGIKEIKEECCDEFIYTKDEVMNKKNKLLSCPICKDDDFIISETDKTKLSSLTNKIDEIENKIKERKNVFANKADKKEVGVIGFIKIGNQE